MKLQESQNGKPRFRIKYIDEIEYCCKKMREYYESHTGTTFNYDNDSINIDGKEITECPFCHTFLEVDVSVVHYGGE